MGLWPCIPSSAHSRGPARPRALRVGTGVTVDQPLPLLFLEFFLLFSEPLSPSPTSPMGGFCRLMDYHLEGGGRPQIPVFLKERINEPLRFVSGLALISVPALLRLGRPSAERKAGDYKALVVLPCA